MTRTEIIAQLVNTRKDKQWTQVRVADKLHVGYHVIQRWERKHCTPRMDNLINWAEALGYELTLRSK